MLNSDAKSNSKAAPEQLADSMNLSKLDFTLPDDHNKVAVVIGDEMYTRELRQLVEEHNGQLVMVDGFNTTNINEYSEKKLRDVDYVILVKQLIKHSTNYAIENVISDEQSMAIANTYGLAQIERAIYRSYKGLPANETITLNIDYPVK